MRGCASVSSCASRGPADGDVSGVTLGKRITLDLNEGNFSVWTLWQVRGF
jgi:hypothetical protein